MSEEVICKNCGHPASKHHKPDDGEPGFCFNCSECAKNTERVTEYNNRIEARKKEKAETEARTQKLEKIQITFTIDGENVKLPSTEVFFIWRAANVFSGHLKLKNFLKRCMDKQLEKAK